MRLYAALAGLLGLSTILLYAGPIAAQEASKPAPSQAPAANRDDREAAASAVAVALAGQLKLHPAKPSGAAVRVGGSVHDRDRHRGSDADRRRGRPRYDILRLRELVE